MKVQQDTITKLFGQYASFITKYADVHCLKNIEECTVMLYGSVMRPMIKMGIWPPNSRKSSDYLNSITAFSTPISEVKIHCYKNHYAASRSDELSAKQYLQS